MNRYEEYKEVDLPWIKEIPSHWDIKRVRDNFEVTRGRVISKQDLDENGIYPVFSSQTENKGVFGYLNSYDFEGERITWTTDGEKAGSVFYRNGKFNCTNICGILSNKKPNNYLFYPFHSYALEVSCKHNRRKDTNGYKIMSNEMKNIRYIVPPIEEQEQIANYLDWKINEIDRLIQVEKEKIKELLKLREISVKSLFLGRNLSENFIKSDYDWIGYIPECYSIVKLKYLCRRIIDGTHNTPKYVEEGIPFLRVTDISSLSFDENIDFNNVAKITKEEHELLYKRCNPEFGDVLVSKNGTIGVPKVVDWDEEFSIFVSLCLLKLKDDVLPEWIYFYFLTNLSKKEISQGGKTGTITNLHLNKIQEFRIPLPEKKLQEQITKKIISVIKKHDEQIKHINKSIANLKSLKESLISEVVTGQIDVRNITIPEYEKVAEIDEEEEDTFENIEEVEVE